MKKEDDQPRVGLIYPETISGIAKLIRKDWSEKGTIYFGAKPYLDAMDTMTSIEDNYFEDSGESIVRYFLANANTWRGSVAREVKTKLNQLLKGK